MAVGGDCASKPFTKPLDNEFEFHFEYLSYPVTGSNPTNIGGFIGYESLNIPPANDWVGGTSCSYPYVSGGVCL